ANALRSLMTCLPFPGTYKNSLIKNEDAKRLMSVPFLPVGLWTAAGGIYGNQAQVRAAKMAIRKQVAGFGRVNFFSDLTLSLLLHLSAAPLIKITRFGKRANESLKAFQPIHQLMQGVPSPEAMDNIGWRHAEPDKMGLLWCAPTISSEGNKAREAIQLAEKIFYEHGFEMPATLTLVRPERLVCVLSIHFDKSDPAERERAHTLYHTLNHRFAEMGIYPYRTSILTMEKMQYEGGKQEVLAALKKIFDPDGLISPGRYGMG
ncbi:MAG TPA: FAD-binding oxidoreductase, partial [bacterium]|nr:FAD-binding oxidoreductase [bacterium]